MRRGCSWPSATAPVMEEHLLDLEDTISKWAWSYLRIKNGDHDQGEGERVCIIMI